MPDDAIVEYFHCETTDGEFWLEIQANGKIWAMLGPFDTPAERQVVHDDMMAMMRSTGAVEMPNKLQ